MKKQVLILLITLAALPGFSQDKYWLFFEKDSNESKLETYQECLSSEGLEVTFLSRWLQAAVVKLEPAQIKKLTNFPFIKTYRKVRKLKTESHHAKGINHSIDDYLHQLKMLNLDVLHANGLTGKGIKIAVFDNGFSKVDSLQAFSHLFAESKIIQTRDFVDPGQSVFEDCRNCKHGAEVLSVLASRMPGRLIGSAPDAEYILLRTEDSDRETRTEEDLFVAAVEYAEELGAQIFNISYGFREFDQGEGDYNRNDMDGNTALITKVADMAASRGILVVASAGNLAWKGITAPSDGDSVLAVGGVDREGAYYFESSQGPSADGRVKPDLVSLGEGGFRLRNNGDIRPGNGTSFAAPLIAGMAACLWQASPSSSNMDIYQALIESGSQFNTPGAFLGYGLPDGIKAINRLKSEIFFNSNLTYFSPFKELDFLIYPNPNYGAFYIAGDPDLISFTGELRVFDQLGKLWFEEELSLTRNKNQKWLDLSKLKPGIYYISFIDNENSAKFSAKKILVLGD